MRTLFKIKKTTHILGINFLSSRTLLIYMNRLQRTPRLISITSKSHKVWELTPTTLSAVEIDEMTA